MVLNSNWIKGKRMHRQVALDKLDWPNVEQITQMALLNLIKTAISSKSSKALNELFIKKQPRKPRGVQGIQLKHKGPLNRKNNSFTVHAINSFNKLPLSLRDYNLTNKKFKIELKKHIRSNFLLTQHEES